MAGDAKFDAIKTMLAGGRITHAMLKPYTKIQASTFSSSKFLIETARDFYRVDGLPANASDADIMKAYDISPGENAGVDPRIALGILINKGNSDAMRVINAAVRHTLLPDSDQENGTAAAQNSTGNRGQWLEVKNESGFPDLNSKVHICTLENESGNPDLKMFPKESRIKKPWNDVHEYLISCINNCSDILKSEQLVCINDLINASGVDTNIGQWTRTDSAQAYLDAVSKVIGKPRDGILITRRGGSDDKRTWGHTYVAVEIARWIDPYFSVMVNDIVLRVMSGDLSLIPQIADQHDKLNASVTNIISVAPGNANQVRQTTVMSTAFDAMTEDEASRQARINAQQEAFNCDVLRELDFSIPITKAMLYERDHISGRMLLAKEPDNRSPKTSVECMLKALKPEAFKPNHITNIYDCIELMWFMIANYENSIAAAAESEERNTHGDMSQDSLERVAELEHTIKSLRSQIKDITDSSRLVPLINGILKTRTSHSDLDLNAIASSINAVINGDYVDPNAVMAVNWHLTYSLGQDIKSHRDFRNLVAVINDIADILRADIGSDEYKDAIPKSFGDIFAPADQRSINAQTPSYWQALNLPEVNAFTCAIADPWGAYDSDQDSKKDSAQEPNPENSYAMLTPLVASKKRAVPTRAAVVKKAESMPDELRAALLKNIEDRANSVPINFVNTIDEYMLHLYIGQLGWAGNIVPKRYAAAPSLVLMVSMREILDAGAWHFRPAGQITLCHPMVAGKAITKLSATTDRDHKPIVQPVNQGAVSMTKGYDSSRGAPWSMIKIMVAIVVEALGKTSVSTILYPDDEFGTVWRLVTPGKM